MKQYFVLLFACMALWGCGGQDQIETPPLKIIDQILGLLLPGQSDLSWQNNMRAL